MGIRGMINEWIVNIYTGNSINSKQAIFNISADVFESILGAIYIDNGFKNATINLNLI